MTWWKRSTNFQFSIFFRLGNSAGLDTRELSAQQNIEAQKFNDHDGENKANCYEVIRWKTSNEESREEGEDSVSPESGEEGARAAYEGVSTWSCIQGHQGTGQEEVSCRTHVNFV